MLYIKYQMLAIMGFVFGIVKKGLVWILWPLFEQNGMALVFHYYFGSFLLILHLSVILSIENNFLD
jgi:hypothetical protein